MTNYDPQANGYPAGSYPANDIQAGTDAPAGSWATGGGYAGSYNDGYQQPIAQDDPNAAIYAAQMAAGQQVSGQYGYDPSMNQQMSSADLSAFIGGGGQQQNQQGGYVPAIQQAYQGMYQQPQGQFPPQMQPQFQQPGYPAPQFQQPQQMRPPQQSMGQNFNPAFGQPNPQVPPNQPLSPEQYFGQAQTQFPQQQPQPGYPQGYQQPPFQAPAPLPGYPTADYGYQQPQYQQPAPNYGAGQQIYGGGYGQQYGQGYNPNPNNAAPQLTDPTAPIKEEIGRIEEAAAANQLAQSAAAQMNDRDSMMRLAREGSSLNGQLMAAYMRVQNVQDQYVSTQLANVRQDYTRQLGQTLQGYFGYTPQQQDLMEFNNLLDVVSSPDTAAVLQQPIIRDMIVKSFAFDKAAGMQGRRAPAAPRDYIPNVNGGMGNNFGAVPQTQGQPFGFQALNAQQRTNFLATGRITR